MRTEYRFICTLRNGLHARPASMLAEAVRSFASEVTIQKVGGDGAASVRSVLSIVGLDVKLGDECLLVIDGPDGEAALAVLHELITETLGAGDEEPGAPESTLAG